MKHAHSQQTIEASLYPITCPYSEASDWVAEHLNCQGADVPITPESERFGKKQFHCKDERVNSNYHALNILKSKIHGRERESPLLQLWVSA